MKLFVDDQRAAPQGWSLARTVAEAIELLAQGDVTELSLDYDLGGTAATGLDVLEWLQAALSSGRVRMPCISAHSGSVLGRRRLEAQIEWLQQRFMYR